MFTSVLALKLEISNVILSAVSSACLKVAMFMFLDASLET